ncbi:PTS system galactitol-specific transporter subunit IIC [Clostridium sartagoforme AAU1]|uniref:PTS system galactitol-specific transporter subunit IIC n=1 Tax=Clostridium sartagoforme AAU1 TaxID=1202534 RepID=R9CER8_9CLOT|nr:PTS transporter subunit IIC [Clostridium sartagoforme]EOR27525.1 PTS system galactitol-specific transporter subunit IIC [Clostridium sartagoforme AAU1]
MQAIAEFFQYVMSLGSYIVLPILIFFIALILGTKVDRAFRSAVFIGIALIGINLMTKFLADNLGPAVKLMSENAGLNLDIIDVGWGAVAGAIWSTPMGIVGIPLILVTNIVLIILKQTKTLDIDIWNYHHIVTAGVLTYVATGNVILGFVGMLLMAFMVFKLADWSAPLVQKFYGLEGISLPTNSALAPLVLGVPLNYLLDKIPFVRKSNLKFDSLQKYLGPIGEPAIMALIIGAGIGIVAKYPLKETLGLAMNLSAVMIILPKIVSILVDGLSAIQDSSKIFLEKHLKGREVYLGLDAAVAIGHPSVLTVSLILIPLTVLIAAVLPGNRMMPFADLTSITFRMILIVALVHGNVLKTLLIGIVVIAQILIAGTITSPLITNVYLSLGNTLPDGAVGISSFAAGSLFTGFSIIQLLSFSVTSIAVCAVVWGLFFLVQKKELAKAINLAEVSDDLSEVASDEI